MYRRPRYFLLGSQTTLHAPKSQTSTWDLRHSLALRTDFKVGTDISGPGPQIHSVQNPLETMLLHLQVWTAAAGPLAAIATDTAATAVITVKRRNPIGRSHVRCCCNLGHHVTAACGRKAGDCII
jgi:hypothetical protein